LDGKDSDIENSSKLLSDTQNVVEIAEEVKGDGNAQQDVFANDAASEPEANHGVEDQNSATDNKASSPLVEFISSAVCQLNMPNNFAESEAEAGNHRSSSSFNDIGGREASDSEHASNKEERNLELVETLALSSLISLKNSNHVSNDSGGTGGNDSQSKNVVSLEAKEGVLGPEIRTNKTSENEDQVHHSQAFIDGVDGSKIQEIKVVFFPHGEVESLNGNEDQHEIGKETITNHDQVSEIKSHHPSTYGIETVIIKHTQ